MEVTSVLPFVITRAHTAMPDVYRFRRRVSGCESFEQIVLGGHKRNLLSRAIEARRVDTQDDNHVPLGTPDALFSLCL